MKVHGTADLMMGELSITLASTRVFSAAMKFTTQSSALPVVERISNCFCCRPAIPRQRNPSTKAFSFCQGVARPSTREQ